MKKISKFIKGNYKFLIGVIVGLLLSGTGVYAANTIYSKNVTYDNSNSGLSATNVQDALDETYNKCFPPTIVDIMKKDAILDTNINFRAISSDHNGQGVYIRSGTENDDNPIYYYRGAVTNNNLIFADTCWKIVRTTETGGTKLIYNGVPSDSGTCNNTGSASQIGVSSFNLVQDSPTYVGYMAGSDIGIRTLSKDMSSVNDTYYYGNSVRFSGTYTLVNTISSSSNNWPSIYNGNLKTHHYTCMGGTTCSTVYYIYYATSSKMYYIELRNGIPNVQSALGSTFFVNRVDSRIKGEIDNWYYTNIEQKGYSNYLEDTVWCNDRSRSDLGGWEPNGGSLTQFLFFGGYERAYKTYIPNLSCSSTTDSFTVSEDNGNGSLDYPVGLLTVDEAMLAGAVGNSVNDSIYLNSGSRWWLSSPYSFQNHSLVFSMSNGVLMPNTPVNSSFGVRPSISLKPGTVIAGGDGSVENPYTIN